MAPKILTPNFVRRLADANQTARKLRGLGFRILTCLIPPGDSLAKPEIEVTGGNCMVAPAIDGCVVHRRVGGV